MQIQHAKNVNLGRLELAGYNIKLAGLVYCLFPRKT